MAGPFDLAKFAPNPTVKFRLRSGHTYKVAADPDVDDVARMLRIEDVVRGRDEDGDVAEAMAEGKELLLDLIRQADPDANVDGFKIGAQEMIVVFGLILHGEGVAEAILEAISGTTTPDPADPASGDPGAFEPGDENDADARGGDVAPLPSAKPSPERSSDSDEPAAGLPATGTG